MAWPFPEKKRRSSIRKDTCSHGVEWGYVKGGACPICQRILWSDSMAERLPLTTSDTFPLWKRVRILEEDGYLTLEGSPDARPALEQIVSYFEQRAHLYTAWRQQTKPTVEGLEMRIKRIEEQLSRMKRIDPLEPFDRGQPTGTAEPNRT